MADVSQVSPAVIVSIICKRKEGKKGDRSVGTEGNGLGGEQSEEFIGSSWRS